jgi:hypothetical protein
VLRLEVRVVALCRQVVARLQQRAETGKTSIVETVAR